jgi:RNA polymerase sigma factor for flagellar operon FliA
MITESASAISRDQLIEQYRPYVRNIVGKIIKNLAREIEFDDLIGYGELGLIEAAERFDPKFNVNFMTFAYYRIRGAVYDGLRSMGWISRSHYAKLRYEERANNYLTSINERYASNSEQHSLQDEVAQISEVISGLASIFITSIDANEQLQLQSEDRGSNPQQEIELHEAKRILKQALEKLPEQERNLLNYYYYQDMTLEQAGQELGLSKSWASRLHSRAIQKLNKLVQELAPDSTT